MTSNLDEQKIIMGFQIKQAREDVNLTQEELANKLNKTKASISKMEQGVNFTSIPGLIIIKHVTHKPYDYFFNPINNENEKSSKEQELLELYRELPDKSKEFVENCLKLLVFNGNQTK